MPDATRTREEKAPRHDEPAPQPSERAGETPAITRSRVNRDDKLIGAERFPRKGDDADVNE